MDRRNFLSISISTMIGGVLLRDASFFAQDAKSEASNIFFNQGLWLKSHFNLELENEIKILPVDSAILVREVSRSLLVLGVKCQVKKREKILKFKVVTPSGNIAHNCETFPLPLELNPNDIFCCTYTLWRSEFNEYDCSPRIEKSVPKNNWVEEKYRQKYCSEVNDNILFVSPSESFRICLS